MENATNNLPETKNLTLDRNSAELVCEALTEQIDEYKSFALTFGILDRNAEVHLIIRKLQEVCAQIEF